MVNKHKAYATHPDGDHLLQVGDMVVSNNDDRFYFRFISDEGMIVVRNTDDVTYSFKPEGLRGVVLHKHVGTLDLTPTWVGVLPALIAALECGTDTGKRLAREELARMAQAADAYNAGAK